MTTTIVKVSGLEDRLDAGFHVAKATHGRRADELAERLTPDQAVALAKSVPQEARRVVGPLTTGGWAPNIGAIDRAIDRHPFLALAMIEAHAATAAGVLRAEIEELEAQIAAIGKITALGLRRAPSESRDMKHINLNRFVETRSKSLSEVHCDRRQDADDGAVLARNHAAAFVDMEEVCVWSEWNVNGGPKGMSIADMGGTPVGEALIAASGKRLRSHLETISGPLVGATLADLETCIAHELYYLLRRRLEGVADAARHAASTTTPAG